MPGFWGADSLTPLSHSVGGTTLANYVINVQYGGAPHDQIVWWGRYFDYGANQGDHYQGNAESSALHNAVNGYSNPTHGYSWICPIASPSVLTGTQANGTYDANYVSGVIKSSLSSELKIPGSDQLYVYLDIEDGEATSESFLHGWGLGIDGYEIGTSYPLYPSTYINPNDTGNVNNMRNAGVFFECWGTEPTDRSCSWCDSPGPSWQVQGVSGFPTNVWQYGLAGPCVSCRGQTIYVDLDYTYPGVAGPYGYGQCDFMLFIP